MSTQTVARRHNGHDHSRMVGAAGAVCPTCGQPVSTKAIQARIAAQEKARNEQFVAELHKAKLKMAEVAQKEVDKVKHDALTAVAETRRESQLARNALQKQMKEAIKQAKTAALATMPAKIAEAVAATKLEHAAEKLKLETALADMQRRLQAKTAHALGEPSEVDLFAALETAFPDDDVSRVVKGVAGPDVVIIVRHGGAPVGKIVLDSKNHARWSNKFTSKLRSDQLTEGADFGVLVSPVFPAGSRELFLQDNVIVVSPARAVVLTHLLRRQIVENHRLKLSAKARDAKAERMFEFITSATCNDLMDRIVNVSADMADLDRAETAAHQRTWSKRAEFVHALAEIHTQFTDAVSAIIAGDRE